MKLEWTTDKPTEPGWYWIKNVRTAHGYEEAEPCVVEVANYGNGYPGNFNVTVPSDECTTELRDFIAAEWAGPLEPPV